MKPWGQDFFLKVEHCFRGVLEIFRQTPGPSLYRGVSQWDMHYTVYVAVVLWLLKMSPNTKLIEQRSLNYIVGNSTKKERKKRYTTPLKLRYARLQPAII